MKFLSNGFIVTSSPQKINGIVYHGVDTEPWPMGLTFSVSSALHQLEKVCCTDLTSVFLADLTDALDYYDACVEQIDNVRILYCETSAENLIFKPELSKEYGKISNFLGFDYAYPSGSYYSAIANDVISRSTPLSRQWKTALNQYGLFSTEESLYGLINDRKYAVSKDPFPYFYERGNFIAFRVFLFK